MNVFGIGILPSFVSMFRQKEMTNPISGSFKPLNRYNMLKSQFKSINLISLVLALVGIAYIGYTLGVVWFGSGMVEPFGFFHAGVAGLALGSAKGADKVSKLPFDIIETTTKAGKTGYALRFDKTAKGLNDLIMDIRLLCTAANVPFFSWPSKNVDANGKQLTENVTYGTMPNGLQIVQNYQTLNLKTAREKGEEIKAAKVAEREATKANKVASKQGGNVALAKIQAIKDLISDGTITADKGLEMIGKIEG